MLVGERMKYPVITVPPEMSLVDAVNLMKKEHIRRTPVVKDGKLIGIVSEKDLMNASPSAATSLSVWEISYLLSKITVNEIMTRNVITVSEDTPIEEAARIMADNSIGGLPVMRGDKLVGIISETNLFKIFLELMGARENGVRVTAMIKNAPGTLARLTKTVSEANGNFIAFGQFAGDSPDTRLLTFKVCCLSLEDLRRLIEPVVERILDIREARV